jgi:hypothetical protein
MSRGRQRGEGSQKSASLQVCKSEVEVYDEFHRSLLYFPTPHTPQPTPSSPLPNVFPVIYSGCTNSLQSESHQS